MVLLIAIVVISVLSFKKYNNKTSEPNFTSKATNVESQILSYDDYQRLFENIVNNITVPKFKVKASTLGDKSQR